jgi:hypothetical protein
MRASVVARSAFASRESGLGESCRSMLTTAYSGAEGPPDVTTLGSELCGLDVGSIATTDFSARI